MRGLHHLRWAAIVSLAILGLFIRTSQNGYWSDGRFLIRLVDDGGWRYHHIGYLPVAHALRLVVVNAPSTKVLLLGLSCAASAAGVFVSALAVGRVVRRGPVVVMAGLLLGTLPAVWFFATCVEVHALQFLAAAGTTLWIVRRSSKEVSSDLPLVVPALWLIALASGHMVGALWGPALALFVWGEVRRGCKPRQSLPALFLLLAFGALWLLVNHDLKAGSGHTGFALRSLVRQWHPMLLWREILKPQFALFVLGTAGFVLAWRRTSPAEPNAAAGIVTRLGLVTASVLVFFIPFCAVLDIAENGAYFYSLAPLFAVGAAYGLASLPRSVAALVFVLALGLNGFQSLRLLWNWEHAYPGHDWAEVLIAEAHPDDLVFALSNEEGSAVFRHSELMVFSPHASSVPLDLEDPAVQALALALAKKRRIQGRAVILTRSFVESEQAGPRRIVELLTDLLGPPQARLEGAYSRFAGG